MKGALREGAGPYSLNGEGAATRPAIGGGQSMGGAKGMRRLLSERETGEIKEENREMDTAVSEAKARVCLDEHQQYKATLPAFSA